MSSDDLTEVKLVDVVLFKNGKKKPDANGDIPIYGGNGILGYTNVSNKENTVIIGRVGAYCGSVYYEPKKCWVSDNAISAQAIDDNNVIFLYYKLTELKLNERRIGTGQPLLTQEILNNIKTIYPCSGKQSSIARILSCLDDKIELNNRINDNLAKQAYTIYRDMFVDNADHKWQIGTISDLGTVVGGSTPSKAKSEYFTNHGTAWITPKDLSINKNKFIAHGEIDITDLGLKNSSTKVMPKGTVLFSSRAPIGYTAIAKCDVTTNQGFKSVIPNINIGTAFIYYFLKDNLSNIESIATGSTFKEVSGSTMKSIKAIIPDDETLIRFSNLCKPIFDLQESLESENSTLSELRDFLLPKLMSGEIDVSEITN